MSRVLYLRICRATLSVTCIDRGIHVVGFFARFDRDVIRADEHDLGGMPVFLHFENDVRLDDLRIIEMQAFDFLRVRNR